MTEALTIQVPDLKKLAEIQAVLDKTIMTTQNIQEDITNRLVVAFKVEFGEFLNEHKFFKFWKVNTIPNRHVIKHHAMFLEDVVYHNPLLEEFVDGVHFLLSIGNQRKYIKFIHAFDTIERKSDSLEFLAMEIFNNPINSAGRWLEVVSDYLYFGNLVGFTVEEIEQAYYEKNKVNFQRQENGY